MVSGSDHVLAFPVLGAMLTPKAEATTPCQIAVEQKRQPKLETHGLAGNTSGCLLMACKFGEELQVKHSNHPGILLPGFPFDKLLVTRLLARKNTTKRICLHAFAGPKGNLNRMGLINPTLQATD